MRQKLHEQMKQKVDDEDDRIAKAVAEEDKKKAVSDCLYDMLWSLVALLELFFI